MLHTPNPILVEATRGGVVESVHRGAYVVCDATGAVVDTQGDIARAVFPRSAIKVMQALPLVESGAADALGLGPAELALACASHNGEPDHARTAAAMLERAGVDETALECGARRDRDASILKSTTWTSLVVQECPPMRRKCRPSRTANLWSTRRNSRQYSPGSLIMARSAMASWAGPGPSRSCSRRNP